MKKIELAKLLATCMHNGQKRGDEPYIKHLEDVYNVLKEFNITDESILIAGYLHDILEDTNMSATLLENIFSKEIADIVFCVTNEIGFNRKERNLKTYEKLRKNPKAVIVKLADRISNVRYSKKLNNSGYFQMYEREYQNFKYYLNDEVSNKAMWDCLDSLFEINQLIQDEI